MKLSDENTLWRVVTLAAAIMLLFWFTAKFLDYLKIQADQQRMKSLKK